ncbi:MAG: DUF3150 domain-containing protein [Burkholderiales bacterium]
MTSSSAQVLPELTDSAMRLLPYHPRGDVTRWAHLRFRFGDVMQIATKPLDHVVLFQVDINLFGAYRRVKSEDIKAAKGVDLSADEVLTLGSQRVFDRKELNVFKRHRDALLRVLRRRGTPFFGGFAVPDQLADLTAKEVQDVIDSAMLSKANLVASFDDKLALFCAQNPAWAPQIRAKAFSAAYVDQQVQFRCWPMRIQPAREEGLMADIVNTQAGGLLGGLLEDIGGPMRKLRKDSLSGKEAVTRRSLRPLRAVQQKLRGFVFLDARLTFVVDMIEAVLASITDDGPIVGADLAMLWGITGILSSAEETMTVAEQYHDQGTAAFLSLLRPQATPVAPQLVLGMDSSQVISAVPGADDVPLGQPAAADLQTLFNPFAVATAEAVEPVLVPTPFTRAPAPGGLAALLGVAA